MPLDVVIAGASGFLGSHLAEELRGRGHTVTALVRRPTTAPDESQWDPYTGTIEPEVIERADVLVNAAGSRLFGNPHSKKWQRSMVESRVVTTRVLADAVAGSERRPALLAGNGSSFYGDHGSEPVTEQSDSRGDAFMTRVTREWQAAAEPAVEAGARVCILRTAPVMARGGDTMRVLEPLFKAFLGARLGNGAQYFPISSLEDWLGAVVTLVEHDTAAGPFNLCCPVTPTNADFTAEFARIVHRRAPLFAPAPCLRLAAGPAAPELLRSVNLRPAALEDLGYRFHHPDVGAVLAAGLA
jgi:uncharacterized protein (TIGR01777 family)